MVPHKVMMAMFRARGHHMITDSSPTLEYFERTVSRLLPSRAQARLAQLPGGGRNDVQRHRGLAVGPGHGTWAETRRRKQRDHLLIASDELCRRNMYAMIGPPKQAANLRWPATNAEQTPARQGRASNRRTVARQHRRLIVDHPNSFLLTPRVEIVCSPFHLVLLLNM